MPVSIGGSENPGNRICAIFLPPQYSCELYDSGLERYRTLKKQSKKTRRLQAMHSQLFVVLLYPPAGSGCCRISCRYSLVLRKMPGIDGAGSQYRPTGGLRQLPDIPPVSLGAPENCANRQGLAGAGSHASSTYAGLIRGYMDVTLSLVCRINMAIRHSA